MAKAKALYFCQNCGAQSAKWIGHCPSCKEWNTYVEELVQKENKNQRLKLFRTGETTGRGVSNQPVLLQDIGLSEYPRIAVPGKELARVLGGGIVPGSLVLFGGEPGVGKSTLMLQLALRLKQLRVLYVSGEESEQQIKMRAERIGITTDSCHILQETNTQNIFAQINAIKPQLLIVDSIQTLYTDYAESSPGSVSQVRECAAEFLRFAKESNTPVFMIGHITKDGSLAGPKVLEHMVDTVLHFEGDRNQTYRLLRATKNRFGNTNELGIYEMQGEGLKEVLNPSEILITQREQAVSGVAIAATMEGNRPLLIETQSLVSTAAYGTPQRSSTGFDLRRLSMLLAVLEKRCGFQLGIKDVFVNIAGGLKVEDPGIDLAVVCAVLSSNQDRPIPLNYCFAAEIGLTGEIRPVSHIEQRISEAAKLGFEKVFISQNNTKNLGTKNLRIKISAIGTIGELFAELFGQ
ncbi:MAG TPA: DNA repair protein RadA [Bacteroidia bacterium]|nr:DNA repair protein RadA [Bacteroidia bacterium]